MDHAEGSLRIEVVYCPGPGQADLVQLRLPAGSTLAQALQASGLLERHPIDQETLRAGIWFRQQPPDTPLRDLDRVEIYRPLTVDPKEARRQRYRGQQHKRSAGTG